MATIARKHLYEVQMHPQMDEDMGKLADRLQQDRVEVFHRAMALYIALKNHHLDQLDEENKDLESPLHVFLESQNNKTEFISG